MSVATWHEMPLDSVQQTDGWHYDDPVVLEKLCTSLRRHGQLRALVVRTASDGQPEVVDGRLLLRAMRLLGWKTAMVADIGVVDVYAAQHLQLDLELRAEADYVKVATAVALMVEAGAAPASLAAASPFDVERIGHFVTLSTWDWSRFSGAAEGQGALAWEDVPQDGAGIHTAPPAEPLAAAPAAAEPPTATRLPETASETAPGPPRAVPGPVLVPRTEPSAPFELPVPPPAPPDPLAEAMRAAIPPTPMRQPVADRAAAAKTARRPVRDEPQLGLF